MPFYLPTAKAGAGAPDVEDGLALARLDKIEERLVEEWVTDSDKYGNPNDGWVIDLSFTLVDMDREVIYQDGDPITLRQAKVCKRASGMGKKSNLYAYVRGMMTPQEFALIEAATPEEPVDSSFIFGRVYNVQISHNDNGWPQVEAVIGPAKAPKGGK